MLETTKSLPPNSQQDDLSNSPLSDPSSICMTNKNGARNVWQSVVKPKLSKTLTNQFFIKLFSAKRLGFSWKKFEALHCLFVACKLPLNPLWQLHQDIIEVIDTKVLNKTSDVLKLKEICTTKDADTKEYLKYKNKFDEVVGLAQFSFLWNDESEKQCWTKKKIKLEDLNQTIIQPFQPTVNIVHVFHHYTPYVPNFVNG